MLTLIAATCCGFLGPAPQGPNKVALPEFPADSFHLVQPFKNKDGNPLAVRMRAAGIADIDGDGNADLWFLAGLHKKNGKEIGKISIQRNVTSGVGRFRDVETVSPGPWVHGTTFRSKSFPTDQILMVHPQLSQLGLLHWNPTPRKDPRVGRMGGSLTGWKIGPGAFEVATADHSGDGHDDILILESTSKGTIVRKLSMNDKKLNFLWPESRSMVTIPALATNLRVLDLNGDGLTDFVVRIPGYGAIAGVDDTKGSFSLAGNWNYGDYIRDIFTGDIDKDGLDEVGLVFDGGVLMQLSTPGGWVTRVLWNPPSVKDLVTGRIAETTGVHNQILVFPRDGKSFVHYPTGNVKLGIPTPMTVYGNEPNEKGPVGGSQIPGRLETGFTAQSVIAGDIDSDGDTDLLYQHSDLDTWQMLRHSDADYRPTKMTFVNKGTPPRGKVSAQWIECQVTLPKEAIAAKVQNLEAAIYVPDPNSKDAADPDYVFFGSLTPWVGNQNQTAIFNLYFLTDDKEWDALRKKFLKYRATGQDTNQIVYPLEWNAAWCGSKTFLSLHAKKGGRRYASIFAHHDPMAVKGGGKNKTKSALGLRWVLRANPPRPRSDTELLPWE